MYALFAAPPDRDLEWQEEGVAGISRFLARVYRLTSKYAAAVSERKDGVVARVPALVRELSVSSGEPDEITPAQFASWTPAEAALLRTLHQTIAKITEDFSGRWHFNTCIAAIMILVNEISAAEAAMDAGTISAATMAQVFRNLTLMLTPFAPFLAAELWEQMGGEGVVFQQAWPVADSELVRESETEIPVQVNGKLATVIKIAAESDEEAMKAAALADAKVAARIAGKTLVKTIVVKGKMVNLVVR
jgi:leucyl-tRNA synthetase